MAGMTSVELEHCRELALVRGSLFELTSRFLPASQLHPMLALYALKRSVSTIPRAHVDDAVKWAKLKWWSEEFNADPASTSRHPVLRALWLSGARAKLTDSLLQKLIGAAISQIDCEPDSDENAMFMRFSALGSTDISLELALDKAEIDSRNLEFLGAATGLFRMISSFAANQRSETERLPLSMLAKYNVNVMQLEQTPHPAELAAIIGQLARLGQDWFSRGLSDLNLFPGPPACGHLQLRWAMEQRRLGIISKNVERFLDADQTHGPTDAWYAWRFLRRLK